MADPDTLTTRSATGVKWMALAQLAKILVTLVSVAFLARRLGPDVFGLMALILTISALAFIVADFGVKQALIRAPKVSESQLSSSFWMNLTVGGVFLGLVIVFADVIALPFDDPRVTSLLQIMAPTFILGAVIGTPTAILEREMRYEPLAVIHLASAVGGAVAAIAAAALGAELGALILQQYVIMVIGSVATWWVARWRPRAGFSWSALRPLLSYGMYLSFAELIRFLSDNTYRPVVAAALSAAALGQISIARQMIFEPVSALIRAVSRVVFPALSSVSEDLDKVRRAQTRGLHLVLLLIAPVCFGMAAVRTPVTVLVLGPGWEMVPPLILLLSMHVLMVAIASFNGPVIKAVGRSDIFFYLDLCTAIAALAALFLSLPYGAIGVVAGRVIVAWISAPIRIWIGCRLIGQNAFAIVRSVAMPMINGALMFVCVSAVQALVPLDPLAQLAVSVALGAVVYLGLCFIADRGALMDTVRLLAGKRAGRPVI